MFMVAPASGNLPAPGVAPASAKKAGSRGSGSGSEPLDIFHKSFP